MAERRNDTSFGTRFMTSAATGQAGVPQALQWFLVSGTLYYLRFRQSAGAHFRITKTVLKATTYVTGTWCVVDLAATLGASNMSWFYDDEGGRSPWKSWGGGGPSNGMGEGEWRDSYNLRKTRTRINWLFEELTVVSGVGAFCYEGWLQGGRVSKLG